MFSNAIVRKAALLASAAGLTLAAITGCSSSSAPSPSGSPTSTSPTATSTPTQAPASCTEASILAALPEGSTMVKYNCENVGGTEWAAVKVDPGPTVFFLQMKNSTWQVSTSEAVCGTASAGLPTVLLNYCNGSTPTNPTASPASASCTSGSILAALPNGAKLIKYNCATVGGTLWAAAKVNPGSTVYFLKKKGSTWQVSTADSVCGTASAGLPSVILEYCNS